MWIELLAITSHPTQPKEATVRHSSKLRCNRIKRTKYKHLSIDVHLQRQFTPVDCHLEYDVLEFVRFIAVWHKGCYKCCKQLLLSPPSHKVARLGCTQTTIETSTLTDSEDN